MRSTWAIPRTGPASAAGYRLGWLAGLPYPLRNTLRRARGMVGMMVGVGIALGVSMTLVAVARASVEFYTADFKRSAADLYVVTRGGTLIPVLPSDTTGTIKHASSVLSQIRALGDVNAALGLMSWSLARERDVARRHDEPTELIAALGVDGDPTDIPDALVLKAGRWLRRSDEVVLGSKLSREKALGIGDSIRLNERTFNVVGIGKLRGLGAGMVGDAVAYLDYRALRQRADLGDVMNIIAIDTRRPDVVRDRVLEIEDLAVSSTADLIQQAEDVNGAATGVRWIFVVLTLTIAGLFVNAMLSHSVSERRLEFATLRAIGIPTRTILATVASEAVLVSVVAGLIGSVVSLALGAFLNGYLAAVYSVDFFYAADASLFLLVFAMALGLGFVSGLLPARQAVRVDPVEVLREA